MLKQQEMKSMNCISATGRIPIIAAPIAAPTIAASLIGVSRTRSSLALLPAGRPWLAARSARSGQALRLPRATLYVSAVTTHALLFALLAVLLRVERASWGSIGLGPPSRAASGGGAGVPIAAWT